MINYVIIYGIIYVIIYYVIIIYVIIIYVIIYPHLLRKYKIIKITALIYPHY